MGQCPRGARPWCQKAGGEKCVPLTRSALRTDPCIPLAGPGRVCRTDPHPIQDALKEGREADSPQPAPSPAPAHFPPNPISTAQCFQLPRPSLQSPAAPSLQNPPKGPAASEFPSPAGLWTQQPSFSPLPSSQPATMLPGAEARATARLQDSAQHWPGWL